MRTPRYLPGVRNGVVAKRQSRAKNPSMSKGYNTGGSSRRRNSRRLSTHQAGPTDRRRSEGRGAKVLWLMILSGVALAAGFVFALRSQINAYRIAQAEEQLKTQLDEYARRQKFLSLDQKRAMSAEESERAARWNGLEHLKLDRETTTRDAVVKKVVSTTEGRNRTLKAGPHPKPAKPVKATKSAKVTRVVKLNRINKTKADIAKGRKRQ